MSQGAKALPNNHRVVKGRWLKKLLSPRREQPKKAAFASRNNKKLLSLIYTCARTHTSSSSSSFVLSHLVSRAHFSFRLPLSPSYSLSLPSSPPFAKKRVEKEKPVSRDSPQFNWSVVAAGAAAAAFLLKVSTAPPCLRLRELMLRSRARARRYAHVSIFRGEISSPGTLLSLSLSTGAHPPFFHRYFLPLTCAQSSRLRIP